MQRAVATFDRREDRLPVEKDTLSVTLVDAHGQGNLLGRAPISQDSNSTLTSEEESGGLLVVAILSAIVGTAAGLLTTVFRLALEWAD